MQILQAKVKKQHKEENFLEVFKVESSKPYECLITIWLFNVLKDDFQSMVRSLKTLKYL